MPLLIAGLVARGRRDRRPGRLRRRQRRRCRDLARPDDRRPRAADRRPVGLRSARPQGRRSGGGADPGRGKEAGADHTVEIVHGTTGPIRRQACRRRASWSTPRTRRCLAGGWALSDHDPDRTVGRDSATRSCRSRPPPPRTPSPSEGQRSRQPDRLRPTASRARRWRMSWRRLWAAPRARPSTSAPATIPTAPASPTRSARRGRRRAAGSGNG